MYYIDTMDQTVTSIVRNCLTVIALFPNLPQDALNASAILRNLMSCKVFADLHHWDDVTRKQAQAVINSLLVDIASVARVPPNVKPRLVNSETLKNLLIAIEPWSNSVLSETSLTKS